MLGDLRSSGGIRDEGNLLARPEHRNSVDSDDGASVGVSVVLCAVGSVSRDIDNERTT